MKKTLFSMAIGIGLLVVISISLFGASKFIGGLGGEKTPTEIIAIFATTQTQIDTFIDDHGVEMASIPEGTFEMGEKEGVGYQECQKYYDDCEKSWFEGESPMHEVYLDEYAIDVYEVTNKLYAEFLNANGNKIEGGVTWMDASSDDTHIYQSGNEWIVESGYSDHPMIEVSWYGARAYCEWRGGRLPSEAEWEKAARGTTMHAYPWGDSAPKCTLANYYTGDGDFCLGSTAPVGSYPSGASLYGVLDMAGNVAEWVNDWYSSSYYSNSFSSNPLGESTGSCRVLRGGSWYSHVNYLRVASRYYFEYPFGSNAGIGFRCAASTPGD